MGNVLFFNKVGRIIKPFMYRLLTLVFLRIKIANLCGVFLQNLGIVLIGFNKPKHNILNYLAPTEKLNLGECYRKVSVFQIIIIRKIDYPNVEAQKSA